MQNKTQPRRSLVLRIFSYLCNRNEEPIVCHVRRCCWQRASLSHEPCLSIDTLAQPALGNACSQCDRLFSVGSVDGSGRTLYYLPEGDLSHADSGTMWQFHHFLHIRFRFFPTEQCRTVRNGLDLFGYEYNNWFFVFRFRPICCRALNKIRC